MSTFPWKFYLGEHFNHCECGAGNSLAIPGDHSGGLFLIDPRPEAIQRMQAKFPDAYTYPLAIVADSDLKMINFATGHGDCSHIVGMEAPIDHRPSDGDNHNPVGKLVPCTTIDEIDPGNWDVVILDMEGSEWLALQRLVSRPKLISVEVFSPHGYQNPYGMEIRTWMDLNRYKVVHMNRTSRIYLKGAQPVPPAHD